MLSRERTMDCIMQCSLGDNTIYLELSMIWRRDRSLAERENMQHRGSCDSSATADSHCAAQGSRNEMEMSRQRSCRDVLFNLACEVAGEGQTSRYFCTRQIRIVFYCICIVYYVLLYPAQDSPTDSACRQAPP